MRSYDSDSLGGPQADPGSSPHGFAAEETHSPGCLTTPAVVCLRRTGSSRRYCAAPALSPRLPARVPVRLDPGAPARA